MLRKLLTNLLILVVAAIPLAITLVNYKLNFDPSIEDKFIEPRTLISDIASQLTFLSITVCILALSDFWDYRSDARPEQQGPSLQRFVVLQNFVVFFLVLLILTNFILYYSEILSVTIVDFRVKKLPKDVSPTALREHFEATAWKFVLYSTLLLASSVILYLTYFFVQTEQKLMARLFWSYSR